jgi:hypothetical protein
MKTRILSRDPNGGNPTLMRQGHGPETTGRTYAGHRDRIGDPRGSV